jgi:pimeloyl-ACP methyl ester carboxylesterase
MARDTLIHLRSAAVLGAWLGPWAPPAARPQRVMRHALLAPTRDGGTVKIWVYRPTRPAERAILISPGVHYDGPSDPRLDRLARILAASGANVAVPFVRDYMRLMVTPRAVTDLEAGWEAFCAAGHVPRGGATGVFSISFGCLPAARLVTNERHADSFTDLVTFGGYASFANALRFALGAGDRPENAGTHDPLNRPVAFATLLESMDLPPTDAVLLRRAWLAYARRTWGRPEMKQGNRYMREALEVARGLRGDDREVFLMGCGVLEGGLALCEGALTRVDTAFTDPFADVARLAARVMVVHGADDDVVPVTEAEVIRERVAPHAPVSVRVTGLYGHTGSQRVGAAELKREAATLVGVIRGLADAGRIRPGR